MGGGEEVSHVAAGAVGGVGHLAANHQLVIEDAAVNQLQGYFLPGLDFDLVRFIGVLEHIDRDAHRLRGF